MSNSPMGADGGLTAKLEQLPVDACSRGLEWLQAMVAGANSDEVRKLMGQVARLPVSWAGGAWLPVAEVRKAFMKHLAPNRRP